MTLQRESPHLLVFKPDQWGGDMLEELQDRVLTWYQETWDVMPPAPNRRY